MIGVPRVVWTPHDLKRRVLGSIPNPVDKRDHKVDALRGFRRMTVSALPQKIDLRPGCSSIEDQLELGSCTQNALAGSMEYLDIKAHGGVLKRDRSRLFGYYNARRLMGFWYVHQDSGATTRATMQSAVKYGLTDEKLWPYDISKFRDKPPVECYRDALDWRVTQWASAYGNTTDDTIVNIRQSLANGLPVIFGTDVYRTAFMSNSVAKTGVVAMPKRGDVNEGGHESLIVGYDDAASMLFFRNSWGMGWGDSGYGYMPYGYVERGYARDFSVIEGEMQGPTSASGWDKIGRAVMARYYHEFGHTMKEVA